MEKERNLYIDVLRGVSILLVVVGHCIQYGAGLDNLTGGIFLYNPVFIFIYSFHMPLFMLISGYLFAYSAKNKECHKLLYIKAKQLLLPLFCWSFINLLIQVIKAVLGVSSQEITLIWMGQTVLSGFWQGPWFLWAIWWSSLLIILGKRFCKDSVWVYIAVCVASVILPDWNNTAVYKFMFPFFLVAYLFNKGDRTKLQRVYLNKFFILACFLAFAILLPFYGFDSYIYISGYTIIGKPTLWQLHNNAFRFTIGVFGSLSMAYMVYALTKIAPDIFNRALAYIGKSTMGIYLFSNYLFDEVLKRIPIQGLNYGYIAIEAVCVLGISLGVTALLKQFKTTNRLFLGGR